MNKIGICKNKTDEAGLIDLALDAKRYIKLVAGAGSVPYKQMLQFRYTSLFMHPLMTHQAYSFFIAFIRPGHCPT